MVLLSGASRAREHWLFLAVLAVGVVLRALATVAYRPALFYSDSVDYLQYAFHAGMGGWHPPGYSWFLAVLVRLHLLALAPALQHLIALAAGLLLYRLLLRYQVSPWAAALGCAPLILDAYQIQIEQYFLAEALFLLVLVSSLAVLLWRVDPSPRRCVAAGSLLAVASLVRLDALVLIAPVFVWLLLRRMPRQALAAGMAFAIPLGAVAGAEAWAGNRFGLSGQTRGVWIYSRVTSFVECSKLRVPADEKSLCPTEPPDRRPPPVFYQSSTASPANQLIHQRPSDANRLMQDFARRAIEAQPLAYARVVLRSFAFQFAATRTTTTPDGATPLQWRFPLRVAPAATGQPVPVEVARGYHLPRPRVQKGIARFLYDYQRFAYTPGPLMAVLLGLAVVGAAWWRRRPNSAVALLMVAVGVLLVLWAAATVIFSWRYMLPTLIAFPPAAVLALSRSQPGQGAANGL